MAARVTVPFVADPDFTLYCGDALEVLRELESESVHICVTSPPYWGLRDYGVAGQLGLEATPEEYVGRMVEVFAEVRRVLRTDGTLWLNLGDSYAARDRGDNATPRSDARYAPQMQGNHWASDLNSPTMKPAALKTAGIKPKDLCGIPWRVAFALQADGWYLRSDIVWSKPNPMPESVTDRPTKSHEYVFLLTKSARYFYDAKAIAEPATWHGPNGKPKSGPHAAQMHGRAGKQARIAAQQVKGGDRTTGFNDRWAQAESDGTAPLTRNARSVWEIQTMQYADAHFAVFPEELARRCILAGCPAGGTVLDPFMGSGTTALVARKLGRRSIGVELNPDYCALAARRLSQQSLLAEVGG